MEPKSLLVVLPVHEKDAHLTVRSLQHALTLDGQVEFNALLCYERGFDVSAVLEAASAYFAKVDQFTYDKWTGDLTWPQGPNFAWQSIARHIEGTKALHSPWLWLEPDAIPLANGWLNTLNEAYQRGERPFAGPVCVQPQAGAYMAGVAIYPPLISMHCMQAMLTRSQPWDIVASVRDGVIRKVHDLSALIHHTPLVQNTHFETRDDIVREIPETAVIFHKCKDGSLLDVIQGKVETSFSPVTIVTTQSSFTEQTEWPSGYFTFPSSTNTAYFNPGLIEFNGQLHLFTRRWRYNLEQTTGGALQGHKNDLAIWKVRNNMTLDPGVIIPTVPARYPHEQWEDPRAVLGEDGLVYIGFSTWVHHKTWAIRQSLTQLSPDWRKVVPLWEAPYGGNQRRPTEGVTHEKNWIWFQHDGAWHCQYSINPGDVFRVDRQGTPVDSWKTKEARHGWTTGLPLRGGTNLTRIGDEYLGFFHTSGPWQKPKRRYYMGAYTMDASPPFTLRQITPAPLLIGSEHDFRALGGPLVIFPGGAVPRGDTWTVAFGVNDEACGWIQIPDLELRERMEPVQRSIIERLAAAMA